ncbi:MAG TPA: hypothetical protein VG326_15835 [Tepidisphaeraceae bacterium]|jgi:hypothetical protein|nr:hypothetical protein [Tepidisphaeraceae bacterium]
MIRFSCRCGYVFEAPEDAVGIGLQCPDCRLLNDVPFLGDLAGMARDGTYKIDSKTDAAPPEALGDLFKVYGKKRVDDFGQPIDLRTVPDGVDDIGQYDTAEPRALRQRPRYDPETGELVKPIPLSAPRRQADPIDPSTIPFATATVNYASDDATKETTGFDDLVNLAQPINLVVMGFVLGIHLFIAFWTIAIAMNFLLVVPIVLALIFSLIAHYGNVVDEIGPAGKDELPRVMRDLQMREDIWHPLFCVVGTAMICYGPAVVFGWNSSMTPAAAAAISAALAIAGTLFMPAILLTSLTSGSFANLRPDRVLGVIRMSGRRYFAAIIIFVVAFIPYFWAIAAFTVEAYKAWNVRLTGLPAWVTMWPVSLPLMCFGIFAMHLFCWELGILYRRYGPVFPWINQFHVQAPRPPVRRRKPKYLPTPPAGNSVGS